MSVLFGILGRNGRPVTREWLELMLRAHSSLPADASDIWLEGEIGFGLVQQYHTPEAPHEVFPLHSSCGRHAMVSHGRLDNREELFDLLNVSHDLKPITPDTALITMAFERWGDAFVERLAGDWACAVWSRERRRLFLSLAPTGNDALYYADDGPFFAFSSTPHGLLALPWVSGSPDLQALGLYLCGAKDKVAGSGFFNGIRALPPSHLLTVDDGMVETREYWRPEGVPPLILRSDDAYIEAFLEQYRRAVACRLRTYNGIAATLSGGLDSGSVVALAAEELRKEGRFLPAFSAVPHFSLDGLIPPGRCGDETPYIMATVKAAGNVEVNLFKSEKITPIAGIRAAIDATASPVFGAANCYWIHDILNFARERALRTLLTGQGGNGTVSWSGSRYLPDYLEGLSSGRALHSVARWLAGQGVKNAGKALLRGLLPTLALLAIMRLRGRPSPAERFMGYSPLRREYAACLDLNEHFGSMDALLLHCSRKSRHTMIGSSSRNAGKIWYLSGAAYGVDVRDPTMDKELIGFLLSIPEEQYNRNNEERRMIRRAMEHLLPPEVVNSRERGLQGADIVHRIRESADEVLETLTALEECPPAREVLDLAAMRDVAQRVQKEVSPELTILCGTLLCCGIGVGLFLKKYG